MPSRGLRYAVNRRITNERRTLEPDFVALQALHSLLEESLTGGGHAGDIILVPFYWSIDRLEYLFDRFSDLLANTVAGDEGDLRWGSRSIKKTCMRGLQCTRHRTWSGAAN